jgi:hypothetical protein
MEGDEEFELQSTKVSKYQSKKSSGEQGDSKSLELRTQGALVLRHFGTL